MAVRKRSPAQKAGLLFLIDLSDNIMITVLAFNLLGDGLRDALDPRLRS
jgi:hypothetical protein